MFFKITSNDASPGTINNDQGITSSPENRICTLIIIFKYFTFILHYTPLILNMTKLSEDLCSLVSQSFFENTIIHLIFIQTRDI